MAGWLMLMGVCVVPILGLSLLGAWWRTPQPFERCNTNGVTLYRKTRFKGGSLLYLIDVEARCPTCSWTKTTSLGALSRRYGDYGDRATVENHRCPTIEELIKPKTWEKL